jgi:hypothetical protein
MSSLHRASVPVYRNPEFAPALEAVRLLLRGLDYTSHAETCILDHLACAGTTAGCAYIDAETEPAIEALFVHHLPEVPLDSACWDRDRSVRLDVDLLVRNEHPFPVPVEDGTPYDDRAFERFLDDAVAVDPTDLPPIAGGAPFEPTAEDWDDYHAWCARVDMAEALRAAGRRREAMHGYE